MRLAVEHRGAVAGSLRPGLSPLAPAHARHAVELPATEVWLETADHMPAGKVPSWPSGRTGTSRESARCPPAWINNGFSGWAGDGARAIGREHGLQLQR